MSMFAINLLVLLSAGVGCLVVGALVVNNPPLYDPPGFRTRLLTYLTTNVAEMHRDHRFPELELRSYTLPPASLFTRVEHAITALGWEIVDFDSGRYYLRAVVETSLLKFKDDVEVYLVPGSEGTELHIRSSSRVGKGDLGANTRHILDLLATLGRQA